MRGGLLLDPARRLAPQDCGQFVIASIRQWQLNALGAARLITERRVSAPGCRADHHADTLRGCNVSDPL
jgi:hypothetical protein